MKALDRMFWLKSVLESNVGLKKNPYKLSFACTYACNSRCTTCNIWKKSPKNELKTQEIDDFFQENRYFQWVDVTGGEVFLRNDIVDVMGSVVSGCDHLVSLHYPTNGLMTDRIIGKTKEIIELNPTRLIVSVSIDGPSDVHDIIRGVPGGFMKSVETLKQLRQLEGVDAFAGMTLSKDNVGLVDTTLKAIQEHIGDFSFHELHVNVAHSSEHYYENSLEGYPKEKVIAEMESVMEKRGSPHDFVSWLERRYQKRIRQYLETGKSPMPCHSLELSVFIDPSGDVYPCTTYDKVVGNIRDMPLRDILAQEDVKKLMKEIHELKCPQCWTPCEAYQSILANLL